ncbi:hypothetical protein [Brevibacillus sp. NRS-1366]
MMKEQDIHNSPAKNRVKNRNHQPKNVQNDAPGYGDKKLEGPNRPST